MRKAFHTVTALAVGLLFVGCAAAEAARVTIEMTDSKPISPLLTGVFYEDLNYAADGGLYAELIENRSFDYSAAAGHGWHALSFWHLEKRGGGEGELISDSADPVHPNNPLYLVLGVKNPGAGVGVINYGYAGIPVKKGEVYDFSLFARQLAYPDGRLTVSLETRDGGEVLASAEIGKISASWRKYTAELKPSRGVDDARLVLLAHGAGRIGIDMVSLFPRNTFKGRPNGLRADLAQAIADLKPKFMRFPGGCLVHGDGLDNMYNWKNSIGPLEQRRGQRNIWRYHQSLGLGYYEYFQFCEDIGAEPLPVVPAGVSCQNSGAGVTGHYGHGQQAVALEDMPAFIQDILDLIEWANAPADSEWGSVRAAAGHPEPFGLKYLGVGNEDHITPVFKERFKMIYEALQTKHPEITVIGTVGPGASGEDYDQGWAFASELRLPMVDEHYYVHPQWFWDNLNRYDSYSRENSKVYVGEYAAHDKDRRNTLRSALAEAAGLTGFERNGDIVHFASYAPLLARRQNIQWRPDMIYFDNTDVCLTPNYFVQQLFGRNSGDRYLNTAVDVGRALKLAASAVLDSASGDLIVKIVNGEDQPMEIAIRLNGLASADLKALRTVLTGPGADAENQFGEPPAVFPETGEMAIQSSFNYAAPANSLTLFRVFK
jgi:alpha-L-arabinofuranosidase